MSVILHVSDLHLGKGQAWERATDDKSGIVPQDENSRLAVLRTSLAAVKKHLDAQDLELDAVVVGGDITTAHDEEGFKHFGELLHGASIAESERSSPSRGITTSTERATRAHPASTSCSSSTPAPTVCGRRSATG